MYDESDRDVEGESSSGIRQRGDSYNSAPLDAYRVLVVAGDERLIALTRLSLAKIGLEVKTATTAYAGLASLDASAHDLVSVRNSLLVRKTESDGEPTSPRKWHSNAVFR